MNENKIYSPNINHRVLHELYEHGIAPSVFIKEFKARCADIESTLDYFSSNKYKENKLPGISGGVNCAIKNHERIRDIINILKREKAYILNISDNHYPDLLKQIYFPPPLLFCKGEKIKNANNFIAIVGTRRNTVYGKDAAIYIAGQLARAGLTIVSGMASGIDYWAHKSAINETGGSIGVLGCGINIIYPPENKGLFCEIIENGSIITEFIPGTPPVRKNFPARNRIISGLCMGVLVIEAPEKSGALITADFALEQNREVFGVPGNIFYSENTGCHNLIKNGAKLVSNIDDILSEVSQFYSNKKGCDQGSLLENSSTVKLQTGRYFKSKLINNNKKNKNTVLNSNEKRIIYDIIGYRPKTVEEIVYLSKLSTVKVLQVISELKLENMITEKSLNHFVRM